MRVKTLTRDSRPVFSYLKSRGVYAGVQVDGTILIERTDENERFYGEQISVTNILAGKVRYPPRETRKLLETIKAAEGRSDVDQKLVREVDLQPVPGDAEVTTPTTTTFGMPEPEDPDPFGVLALEKAGLEIREAGTRSRPESSQFEFNPAPSSPLYQNFHRPSMDTLVSRSGRGSILSHRSSVKSTDRGTQTADLGAQNRKSVSPKVSPRLQPIQMKDTEEEKKTTQATETRSSPQLSPKATQTPQHVNPPAEVDYTKIDLGALDALTRSQSQDFDGTTVGESPAASLEEDERRKSIDSTSDLDSDDEEPVIFEVASTQATIITPRAMKVQGGLVDIPKRRPPPPLPPRSSARNSRVDGGSARSSPLKESFDEVDLIGNARGELTPDHRRDSFLSVSSVNAPAIPPRRRSLMSVEDMDERTSARNASRPVSPAVSRVGEKQTIAEEKEESQGLASSPGAVQVR